MTQFEEPEFGPQAVDPQAIHPEDEAGDPAPSTSAQEAFEALRDIVERQGRQIGAEMTVIRRGVEAAFDRFETVRQPADYSADLGRLVQGLAVLDARLKAVEVSPILRNGPEHYARALERGGESLVKTAAQQFQSEGRDLQRLAREMAGQIAGARERRVQNRLLWIVGVAGLAAGILATLFLPAMLPGPVAPHVASVIMAKPLWQAGMSIMEFDDAASWDRVVAADELFQANRAEVAACQATAAKTGKGQTCTITVGPSRK